jgi:hypothetical protein
MCLKVSESLTLDSAAIREVGDSCCSALKVEICERFQEYFWKGDPE